MQLTAVFAKDTISKNIVIQSFDFSVGEQTTTDETALNLPILTGGAEYNADNENIRLNAKNSAAEMVLKLENAVAAENEENIINVDFDMNFGSITGQSFTYSIASSTGDKLIDFCFEPYKDAGTAYIKIGGADVVSDITDDTGAVSKTVNRQIKDCVSAKTGDGMGATVTHFQNEINLVSGTAKIYITSEKKSGEFSGEFDSELYGDIASLEMAVSKSNSTRHSYIDNIKISQQQKVEAPKPEELVQHIVQDAAEDLTVVDTSKMVYGGHISAFLVTTAKDGVLIRQYTTDIADSVSVNTQNADSLEISPVYTYTSMNDEAFNTAEGIILSDMSVLDEIENGRYDISIQKADGKLTDIYINGGMVANNVEQTGKGRGTPKGALYTANDIKIEGGSVRINTQRDEWNGTTYPSAPISDITIKKSPSIVNRKTKITVLGDSLVAEYYGGRRESDLGSNQTGWGQQLSNFIDTRYGVIRDAQTALCENDADFVLAGSLEPYQSDMKDKYHYNQSTYNSVGKTVGKNISEFYGVN